MTSRPIRRAQGEPIEKTQNKSIRQAQGKPVRQAQGKLKKQITELPQKPGVYFFKNGKEEIIYIGKAINIKKRVKQHFTNGHNFANFYPQVRGVDYITVKTERDALILENQLIKRYQPKYNIDWKDDKNYSFVAFSRESLPRVFVTHQPKSLDADVIGPFVSGLALKNFLFEIRKLFPYRTCKNKPENPCLYYDLGLCWAHGKESMSYPLVLQGLQSLLRLYNGEKVITECYDISNTQGTLSVGSMVSFKGHKPYKDMYRRFKIKTVQGSDDPKSMEEIVSRRLSHPEWTYPDLIVIDGGRTQLSRLKNISVPVIALAKFNREKRSATIFSAYGKGGVPLSMFPLEISDTLLALRDEAHRFAITYHRKRRETNLLA